MCPAYGLFGNDNYFVPAPPGESCRPIPGMSRGAQKPPAHPSAGMGTEVGGVKLCIHPPNPCLSCSTGSARTPLTEAEVMASGHCAQGAG